MMHILAQRRRRGVGYAVLALVAGLLGTAALSAPSHAAVSHTEIDGSGSTWSANAINVWIASVNQNGLKVVFTPSGSTQGRKDFGNGTTDFGVSDIGYLGKDPITNDPDLPCPQGTSSNCRDYAYLPVVAGGTSFPYHVEVGGKLVRNIRLSGQTLAKIFTGGITNWNDAAITADNNGRQLPSLAIIPVTHSEGSGSTYQFTAFLNKQYPSIWQPFGTAATEFFPNQPSIGPQYNGSDGIMNFITSAAANGSIGYDEYSYAVAKNYPVIKLQNAAGYYNLPTQYNVAVALQKAQINMDPTSPNYLLQDLTNVYTDTDPRAYAMSSYSYIIIPTGQSSSNATPTNEKRMTTAKRQTLADFLTFSVCDGQGLVGQIGYSALPLNLVQASLDQLKKLQQADSGVDLTSADVTRCNNPTFVPGNLSANHLADIDPSPPACDQTGQGPCDTADAGTGPTPSAPASAQPSSEPSTEVVIVIGINGKKTSRVATPSPRVTAATTGRLGAPAATGSVRTGANGAISSNVSGVVGVAGVSASRSGSAGATAAAQDPDLGGSNSQPSAVGASNDQASGVPTSLVAYRQQNMTRVLAPLTVLLLVIILFAPPLFYHYVLKPRREK